MPTLYHVIHFYSFAFLLLVPIALAEEAFLKTTPWNDLAFPRLAKEERPEGKKVVSESHAILVKFDSAMKVWRTPSCTLFFTFSL
jgi:hypothetical protein